MIFTTTPNIEGKKIEKYHGIVFGEVTMRVNLLKDFTTDFCDIFSGRSPSYEDGLQNAREKALQELEVNALAKGANAVVGIHVDYEVIATMLMVTISGTAVTMK